MTHLNALPAAVQAARNSPCQSQRGAAIWDHSGLISVGWNNQPAPFICDRTEACKRTCGRTALHAEQHAILMALRVRVRDGDAMRRRNFTTAAARRAIT